MQLKDALLIKSSKNNSQINKADKVRHYLLNTIKEELNSKKINKINYIFSIVENNENHKKTMSKSTSDESHDNLSDDGSSSNDISCEEVEEILIFKKY